VLIKIHQSFRSLKTSLVGKNLTRIKSLLSNVEKLTNQLMKIFLAWKILETMSEVDLWIYERRSLVENRGTVYCWELCSLAFCYLLQRCCFTLIEPVSENWAFDMFQSLNATGTPLTALETFKPLVVSLVASNNGGFKGSKSEEYFEQVDQLLGSLRSASSKNKLTNDYLTVFALTHDGTKLSTQFSAQKVANWKTTDAPLWQSKKSSSAGWAISLRIG